VSPPVLGRAALLPEPEVAAGVAACDPPPDASGPAVVPVAPTGAFVVVALAPPTVGRGDGPEVVVVVLVVVGPPVVVVEPATATVVLVVGPAVVEVVLVDVDVDVDVVPGTDVVVVLVLVDVVVDGDVVVVVVEVGGVATTWVGSSSWLSSPSGSSPPWTA